ncbi:aminobenzoyl-glutamate utilization protein [Klebsiella pneumoniae]|nr:aminobenzoyl-glutamate utilization protein [Klebsiella pneumoniae]
MSDYVIPEIKATEAEMISIRHYLHANPGDAANLLI